MSWQLALQDYRPLSYLKMKDMLPDFLHQKKNTPSARNAERSKMRLDEAWLAISKDLA